MDSILSLVLLIVLVVVGSTGTLNWRRIYHRLLTKDIVKWQEAGWVTESGAKAILEEAKPKPLGNRLVFLVGLLGVLLLLFAALSFIAANWDNMSRLARLSLLMALLWAAYLIGWRLVARGMPLFAEAAWLLGGGLFGVNIVLIAQMFHLNSHPPSGVLFWTLGVLLSAYLLHSRAALAVSFGGTLAWSLMETFSYNPIIHLPFLLLFAPSVVLAIAWRWGFAYHVAFLTFVAWLVTSLVKFGFEVSWVPHGIVVTITALFMLLFSASLALHAGRDKFNLDGFDDWLERYSIMGLLVTLFVLQVIPQRSWLIGYYVHNFSTFIWYSWFPLTLVLTALTLVFLLYAWRKQVLRSDDLVVLAATAALSVWFAFSSSNRMSTETFEFVSTWIFGAAFLAFLLWLISFDHRRAADLYVWAALVAFGAEILYIYFRIFGSLLETSLFFLMGGVLTLLLALFLYRLYHRLDTPPTALKEASQ